ncbi:restriction endonuclease [Methanofollis fontis]|nr:restriction endonuclease [Methanofollis fontis]
MGIMGGFFRRKNTQNKEDIREYPLQEDFSHSDRNDVEDSCLNNGETIGINYNSSGMNNTDENIEAYVSRYLSNAPEFFLDNIIYLSELQSCDELKIIYDMNDWSDLDRVEGHIFNLINESNDDLKATSDPEDKENIRGMISIWESYLKFINDSKKFKKVFDKNGYIITFPQYFSIFLDCINKKKAILQKEDDDQLDECFGDCFEPYMIIWKNKLGPNPTISQILKEIYCTSFPDLDDEGSEFPPSICRFLLRKFGYDCSVDEIRSMLSDIEEEVEIDNFEANLENEFNIEDIPVQKAQKIDISDLDGYQFERTLCDVFEQLGYTAVLTSKSRDQGADLVISQDGTKAVVQAKYYEGKVSNAAIQEVVASKAYYGADDAMVVTTGSFTSSALELAEANDVVLWDGERLSQVLSDLNEVIDPDIDVENRSEYCCPFCDVMFLVDAESLVDNNVIIECPRCDNDIFFEDGVIISEDDIRAYMDSSVEIVSDYLHEVCDFSVVKLDAIVGLILDLLERSENFNDKHLYAVVYKALSNLGMTYDYSVVKELVNSVEGNNRISLKDFSERSHESLRVSVDSDVDEIGFFAHCPACGGSVEINVERNDSPQKVELTCPHCGVLWSSTVTLSQNPWKGGEDE